jgi:hypothetical protein
MTERNTPSAGCVSYLGAGLALLREVVDQVGVFDRFQQVLRVNAE